MMTPLKPQSVTELVNRIKGLLEGEIGPIIVSGEVSNFSLSSSGHYYFTLSDRESAISVALFRMDALRNPLLKSLKDGDKIICSGVLSVYGKRGTFQIVAKRIEADGQGELQLRLEALKKRLAQEGLFDPSHKRPIPPLPQKVAIITAINGAALRDFLHIFQRRSLWMDVVIVPALVQGEQAPSSLISALERVNRLKDIDVVVLARGGGSLEDLWAFNDEKLAYAIYNSSIPVISAVGHQVDVSISDWVADLRCETPSSSAETLTAGQVVLHERLNRSTQALLYWIKGVRDSWKIALEKGHPKRLLQKVQQKVMLIERRVQRLNLQERYHRYLHLADIYMRLEELCNRLTQSIDKKVNSLKTKLLQQEGSLFALNPTSVLTRGYSLIRDEEGKIITDFQSFQSIELNSPISIQFHDGIGKGRKGDG